MKKISKRIISFILIVSLSLMTITAVRADSGWDSNYDAGGWSSSDSGWSSSDSGWSSSDNDWSSSSTYHSSSGSYSGSGGFFLLVVIFVTVFVIIICSKKSIKRSSTVTRRQMGLKTDQFKDVSEELIKSLLPGYTLDKLKKELFNKFVDIQLAWMEFDYDKLRTLCTDELYNSYIAQLEVLKAKFGKNIMEYFDNMGIKVYDIKKENNVITIEVFMAVSFYDYVINTMTNKITRGTKTTKIVNNYKMTFVVSSKEQNIDKCPSCGAPIKDGSSTVCEYCNSTIVKPSNEFVLSKKTNIND